MTARYCLLLAAALCGLFAWPLSADEGEPPARPVTIIASPEILPPGTVCEVEMVAKKTGSRSTSSVTYLGMILETTKDGLRLEVTEVRGESRNEGLSTGLPFIDRHFTNSGVAVSEPPADEKEIELATRAIESIRVIAALEVDDTHEPVAR